MAICSGCGTTNDEKRRDPDTGVLLCRRCQAEIVEEVAPSGKEKKGKGDSKSYSKAPTKSSPKGKKAPPEPEVAAPPRSPRIRADVKTVEKEESQGRGRVSLDKEETESSTPKRSDTGFRRGGSSGDSSGEQGEKRSDTGFRRGGSSGDSSGEQGEKRTDTGFRRGGSSGDSSGERGEKRTDTGFRRGGSSGDSSRDSSREQAEQLAEGGFRRGGRETYGESSREQAEQLAENGFEGRGTSRQGDLSSVRGAIQPYGFCWGSMLGGVFLPVVNGNLMGTIQLFIVGTLTGMVPLMGPFISFYYIATQVPAITAKECSYTQAEYNLIFSTLDKMGRASMILSMVFFGISLLFLFLNFS